jgi:cytochrome c oxidase cbb3-type subunit 3
MNDNTIQHNETFDGIEVAHNGIPPWWKWIFIGTACIALPYLVIFGAVDAPTLEQRYSEAVAANARLAFSEIGELNGDTDTLVAYAAKPEWVAYGESVYKANCVSCHGVTGGGLVGPNLCDQEYLHVNQIADIYRVINEGANRGAMPAWINRLGQNDRVLVAAYVASLRGTNPGGNAKGPQGKSIEPWPKASAPAK